MEESSHYYEIARVVVNEQRRCDGLPSLENSSLSEESQVELIKERIPYAKELESLVRAGSVDIDLEDEIEKIAEQAYDYAVRKDWYQNGETKDFNMDDYYALMHDIHRKDFMYYSKEMVKLAAPFLLDQGKKLK